MTLVHALTPVTRPENLPAIEESLNIARAVVPAIDVEWHVAYDLGRRHVGGWTLRNAMLDKIPEDSGWVWLLDDDTIAHPDVLSRFDAYATPDVDAVVFEQERPDGWHRGCADPAKLRNGDRRDLIGPDDCVFDTGQAILRRSLIGSYRFRDVRAADGYLWDDVLAPAHASGRVAFVREILAYYNRLRPGEWG